jgi:hypothetical protein
MPFWFEVIQKGRSLPELTAEVWLSRKSGAKPDFSWAMSEVVRIISVNIKRGLSVDKIKEYLKLSFKINQICNVYFRKIMIG